MSDPIRIIRVEPPAGISGGEVTVAYAGVTAEGSRGLGVLFDAKRAHITAIGGGRARGSRPELITADPPPTSAANFMIGPTRAGGLLPVANPSVDPHDGSLYVTPSRTRGEN